MRELLTWHPGLVEDLYVEVESAQPDASFATPVVAQMAGKAMQSMMKERQKRNRFMGWVLILMILLFILPTYNLAQSYQQLLQRRQQLSDLQTQYQTLSEEKEKETAFATKLKDEDYAAKYMRAKYYYSKNREAVYTIPDLLPR